MCFGNIFETGALADPEFVLRKDQKEETHQFDVCGEERITLILGWDNERTPLRAKLRTPSGVVVGGKKTKDVRGRTWSFWKVDLPYKGERDGRWSFVVKRQSVGDVEFQPPPTDVKYFYLVVSDGGPKLTHLSSTKRVFTGDPVLPLVELKYPNGTVPANAQVTLQITAPRRLARQAY